jgi:gliding motility-associated-like protein
MCIRDRVINYKNYLPNLISIEPDAQSADPCSELDLLINADIPKLIYKTLSGNSYELPRTFTVKYQNQKWDNDSVKWSPDNNHPYSITLPATRLTVPAPFCDTKFKLVGDQYAVDLGIDIVSVSSKEEYQAVAVECHLKALVSSRAHELNNEANAPDDKASDISFSVPIDVQFLSNANEPTASFYSWSIYKDGQLIINRTDRDHRYTFTDYGTYKVKVVVSSAGGCSYSDSTTVNAFDAAIQVPKVFTPNGDGQNDEFRVAYKSLLGFECWVYNRWGRKVYHWTDPQKGWDGKIGGKDADECP